MFSDDELVPISALQHYLFCPRQCALIHIEQCFEENIYTLRGRAVHEKAHSEEADTIEGIRVERSLHLKSNRLGLVGISDIVEFDIEGNPFPVEYKSGSKKVSEADFIQLTAQSVCLEEMLSKKVDRGAIFYAASKKRVSVKIDSNLVKLLEDTTIKVRNLLQQQFLPLPINDSRCNDCSLIDVCQPKLIASKNLIGNEFLSLFEFEEIN